MMCHAGMIFLPPGTHMYLTCMSARLEGTWSTTDYELHGVPKARVNLGPDRTVCVVARSSWRLLLLRVDATISHSLRVHLYCTVRANVTLCMRVVCMS